MLEGKSSRMASRKAVVVLVLVVFGQVHLFSFSRKIPFISYSSQGKWALAMVADSKLLMGLFGDRLKICQERRKRMLGPKC